MSPSIRLHRGLRFVLLAILAYSALRGVRAALRTDASDFEIYYRAGEAVLRGEDPSAVRGYIYLPFFAVCVAPLAWLPYALAAAVWQLASLGATAKSASITAELVRGGHAVQPDWLDWAPLACVLRVADSNLGNGQVNALILVLVLLGLRALRNGSEWIAGAWIGFAAALKILPICLLLFFLAQRARRAMLAGVTASTVCVLLVAAVAIGWSANLGGLAHWFASVTQPYIDGGDSLLARRPYVPGQSLTAAAYRALSATPATSLGADTTANVFELEPAQVAVTVRIAQALLVALLCATLVRSRHDATAWLHRAALVIAAALLLAPLVHKAHMVWMILPFAVLLHDRRVWSSRPVRGVRWALVAFAIVSFGASAPAVIGRFAATFAVSHNAIFWGALAIFAALAIDLWGARPATDPAPALGG